MPLLMKDLRAQQDALLDLATFARDHGELAIDHKDTPEYLGVLAEATKRQFDREELERFTRLTQAVVSLPVYTTGQAAAWLGMTESGLAYVIWRVNPPLLKVIKPGHDVLVTHQELTRYAAERRYGGNN